jgi:hypothetical protein
LVFKFQDIKAISENLAFKSPDRKRKYGHTEAKSGDREAM